METKFVKGSFVDFKGIEHKFTLAGVVTKVDACTLVDNEEDFSTYSIDKVLSIGISICNPGDSNKVGDEYNDKIGMFQAEGRAKVCRKENEIRKVFVTKGGMLNEFIVEAFLKDTAENLAKNPGLFIKGYNTAKKKWENTEF